MAGKRIAQSSINWAAIAERVPAEQKANFMVFKAKSDAYMRKVISFPETTPKIDWAFYKSKVPLPAMVDEFQKKYEAFKIPLPDDTVSAKIDSDEKTAAGLVQQFKKESEARSVKLQEELKKYESRIPIAEMSMEDFAYYYPDQALDPLNRPTYWPHDEESQPGPEDEKADAHGH